MIPVSLVTWQSIACHVTSRASPQQIFTSGTQAMFQEESSKIKVLLPLRIRVFRPIVADSKSLKRIDDVVYGRL
jgi:hypothetical protein